jgi:hypothetical protein
MLRSLLSRPSESTHRDMDRIRLGRFATARGYALSHQEPFCPCPFRESGQIGSVRRQCIWPFSRYHLKGWSPTRCADKIRNHGRMLEKGRECFGVRIRLHVGSEWYRLTSIQHPSLPRFIAFLIPLALCLVVYGSFKHMPPRNWPLADAAAAFTTSEHHAGGTWLGFEPRISLRTRLPPQSIQKPITVLSPSRPSAAARSILGICGPSIYWVRSFLMTTHSWYSGCNPIKARPTSTPSLNVLKV